MPNDSSPDGDRGALPARRFEIGLAVALLFAALKFAPILRNSFFSDDFYHLYDLVNSSFAQFLARTHGGHIYLFRNFVFFVCYLLFRTQPVPYYALALATHLLNVFLVHRIIRTSSGSARAACFGATLWGILPANEGALGWYSVYGHALATTFSLGVLCRMSALAAGGAPLRFEPLLWAAALALGATCFGVGLGLAGTMPVVAFLFLPPSPLRRRAVIALSALAALLPVLYRSVELLDSALHGEPVDRGTALLSALQVWPKQLQMLLHLIAFAASSLVFGSFEDVVHFPPIFVYGAAIGFGALVLGLFAVASGTGRRRALACALLGLAAYATIAAGRGMFVDPANPMSMAGAQRFHYAGPCMLALAFGVLLGERRLRFIGPRFATALLALWLAVMLRGVQIGRQIDHHDGDRLEAAAVLAGVRGAVDDAEARDEVYLENRNFLSIGPLLFTDHALFPGWGALFLVYFPDGFVAGKRVRFVERDPRVLAAARRGRRGAQVFVAPGEVPASARLTDPSRPRRRPGARLPRGAPRQFRPDARGTAQ